MINVLSVDGSRHRKHFSRSQSCPHPHHDRSNSLQGTPHALFPATTEACATPLLTDTPITPHTMIPTGIVTLHPALTTSCMGATHTTPWTRAGLTPAAPTTQHKDLSPGRSNNAQGPQPP